MNIFNDIISGDFDYIYECLNKDVIIDNVDTKAWIKNTKTKNGYHERELISEFEFHRGSIIDYKEDRYINLSDSREKKYKKYHKGNIRLVNERIYFKIDNKDYLFPCCVEVEGMRFENTSTVTLEEGKITVTLQDNDKTRKIKDASKFVALREGWEIMGIDISYIGLIKLHCKKAVLNIKDFDIPVDAVEYPTREGGKPIEPTLPPVDPPTPTINYKIDIIGDIEVKEKTTSQYLYVVKADGVEVFDKTVEWSVTDIYGGSSYASINSSGLLIAGAKENIIIRATLTDDNSIFSEKQVKVFSDDWAWG